LFSLLDILNEEYKNKIDAFDFMAKSGKISFSNITSLFNVGTKFVTTLNNKLYGGIVVNVKIELDGFGNKYLRINSNIYYSYNNQIKIGNCKFTMYEFRGVKNITDLLIRPATKEDLIILSERVIGDIY